MEEGAVFETRRMDIMGSGDNGGRHGVVGGYCACVASE